MELQLASQARGRVWFECRRGCVAVALALLTSAGCATQGSRPEAGDERFPSSPDELRSVLGTAEEIEEFLRTARVGDMKPLDTGVTHSSRITLSKDDITIRALWKTIDEFSPVTRFAGGTHEMRFKDSYKNEIAAYELAKLLDLPMVPPAVERRIGRTQGCVQLWLEGTRSLAEVLQQETRGPDVKRWIEQLNTVHLFHQLIYDTDRKNYANVLIDDEFDFYIIDSSRAFRLQGELPDEQSLLRFSRSLLVRLKALTSELLHENLRPWISKDQIASVLARRDLIVKRAESLIATRGEASVLF